MVFLGKLFTHAPSEAGDGGLMLERPWGRWPLSSRSHGLSARVCARHVAQTTSRRGAGTGRHAGRLVGEHLNIGGPTVIVDTDMH